MERWVLGMALMLGMAAGNHARLASAPGRGRDHAWFLRRFHLPLAGGVAVAMCVLQRTSPGEWTLILFNGWLAFCAGFDFEIAARPLIEGRDYRFRGPIHDPADLEETDAIDEDEEDPVGWFRG